ncbi:efflux RND transporter periplasmic adaptor subunit [Thermithiobacillus plumbiphilus]|uniref:Efflux RND transporter periplasmic adaptor subunit n=1 Tax=Thermithiobacillus plumbiphilus TaxID=1729899 RepID=A0ABU9DA09_9PROT
MIMNKACRRMLPALVFGALLALSACGREEPASRAPAAQAPAVSAEIMPVAATQIQQLSEVPGTVIAEDQVQVSSRLMGYIRDITVHEGDPVRKGQLLFSIDPTDVQAQIGQARAGMAQAEAGLAAAKLQFERSSALLRDESIPRVQYDQAKTQLEVARAQMAQARAAMQAANAQLKYVRVGAPITGVVTQKLASAGDLAAPGKPVLVIENPDRLQVQVALSESLLAGLKPNDPVQVRLEGGNQALTGQVLRILPSADPTTHSYTVKIGLPAGTDLRSGSYVRVAIPQGTRIGVRVPQSALVERADITGVFVVDQQGVAHLRMVRTGQVSDGAVEILSGLNPGERIVRSNTATLQSGDRIDGGGHG